MEWGKGQTTRQSSKLPVSAFNATVSSQKFEGQHDPPFST
jgi:hypothetical protein